MELICHIILIFLLLLAFYQDWKYRAISWLVFPLILSVAIGVFYFAQLSLLMIISNLFFVVTVITGLFLYVSFKRGSFTNIFKSDLGIGDVLFLLAITPLFMDQNFILFFISGMLISGIVHLILYSRSANEKIPLAGYLALYLIGLKAVEFFVNNDLFYQAVLG